MLRNPVIRKTSDVFLTVLAVLLVIATLVITFARPPQVAGLFSPDEEQAPTVTLIPVTQADAAVEAAALLTATPDAAAVPVVGVTPTAPGEFLTQVPATDPPVTVPQTAPTPLPILTLTPTPAEVAAIPGGDASYDVNTDPLDQVYSEYFRQLASLVGLTNDPYAKLVVRPLDRPDLEVNFEGDQYQNAASTLKAAVLVYAIFRDPGVGLNGWQTGTSLDAYKMIVGSHNTATGEVLNDSRDREASGNALDQFDSFLHDIVGLSPTVGLTQWNYGATQGYLSFNVDDRDPALDPERVAANPVTLDALVAYFEFLETPNWIEGAITRAWNTSGYPLRGNYESQEAYRADVLAAVVQAKQLMTIPDPERATEIELALTRAQTAYPAYTISMYGKNGSLGPSDWPEDRWHVNEVALITVAQGERSQRCIVAYSASMFENGKMLDGALNYCVSLFEQRLAGAGG